ncbi:hypothetical protein TNCV_2468001 [Trichonephila clavipes]|nr:hypothetical protein TNCV_2468001 [Trichonephila clavipes]
MQTLRLSQAWFDIMDIQKMDWPFQNRNPNPIKHPWDEFERYGTNRIDHTLAPAVMDVYEIRSIADILQKSKSSVSDVIVKWKHRGSETAEKRTGRPKILGECSRRTLKRAVKQNRKSSLVEISQEFQSSSGISASSRTVRRERVKKLRIPRSCSRSQAKHHST